MRIPERLFRFRFSGIIPIFALPVLLTGCASFAPRPIVQYRNLDPDPVFVRGLQVNAYRADSLRFSVAVRDFSWDAVKYLQSHVYPLTFIVNVRNRGSAAILIDPADFSLAALPGDSAQPLIDPELVLYTFQEEIERLRAERMASDSKQAAFGFEDFAGKDDADSAAREETARKRKEARDYHRERNELRTDPQDHLGAWRLAGGHLGLFHPIALSGYPGAALPRPFRRARPFPLATAPGGQRLFGRGIQAVFLEKTPLPNRVSTSMTAQLLYARSPGSAHEVDTRPAKPRFSAHIRGFSDWPVL